MDAKTAKDFLFEKYPDAEKTWGMTNHDDRFMVRMMEEYAKQESQKSYIKGRNDALTDAIQEIKQTFSSNREYYRKQITYFLERLATDK